MTYDAKKVEIGRESLTVVEMDLGFCSLTYGVSPCTASGSAGEECFNTRFTCQDPDNYADSVKTYRYCQQRSNLPVGVAMVPSIIGDVARAPTTTTGGKGLGKRAVVKVQFKDHAWHDRDLDPYHATRSYTPEQTGTYWGKWIARNPYFEGRELRVLTGFISSPFSWDDFQTEYYDITEAKGPSAGGFEVTAKDALTRTYKDKVTYPVSSDGVLDANITAAATSATLSPAGIGNSDYPASGYVSMGKEIAGFTRSADVLTLTRAEWGTTADSHSADDTVQICAAWESEHPLDVLEELLVTGAGIPASFIPNGVGENWTTERDIWMTTALLTGILSKPEQIDKVIAEISECFRFDIWWEATAQTINIKSIAPDASGVTPATLNDLGGIVENSVRIKKDSKQRVSEVRVYYNKLDYSEKSEPKEFRSLFVSTDPNSAGSTRYGSENIREIFCRWFNDAGQAITLATRTIERYVETPSVVTFEVDLKDNDSIPMAQRVRLDTRHIQGPTGENANSLFQVTEVVEIKAGSRIRVKGLTSFYSGRFWFIAPDTVPDYSSATAEERGRFGFVCYDTNVFLDGEEAYKII